MAIGRVDARGNAAPGDLLIQRGDQIGTVLGGAGAADRGGVGAVRGVHHVLGRVRRQVGTGADVGSRCKAHALIRAVYGSIGKTESGGVHRNTGEIDLDSGITLRHTLRRPTDIHGDVLAI